MVTESATAALKSPSLAICGTRGIPARHGGFETFAERLALHLVSRGWDVTVYCQNIGKEKIIRYEMWQGVRLIQIPSRSDNALATAIFDLRTIKDVARRRDLVLTLGYNTALFNIWLRVRGITNIINMDGLEWQRAKWSPSLRAWLYGNERAGCLLGDHLIADHPEIAAHLATRVNKQKITMIPYGADTINNADVSPVQSMGLLPGRYAIVIARPEPENSILEIVTAFTRRPRGIRLVVLGRFDPARNPYHRQVVEAANEEVLFPGAIYDAVQLRSLRYHCSFYIHGHQVGGTNPSLIEALGAGSAVMAHDNRFNRWVAGPGALYFSGVDECEAHITRLIQTPQQIESMKQASRVRHELKYTWPQILNQYENLLTEWYKRKFK